MKAAPPKTIQEELHDSFTDDYIYNVGYLIHNLAEKFYEENQLEGKVYFNDDIFKNCLIDILVDLARLKYFHDIGFVNYVKLMSYSASWIIKRKPFQIIEGTGSEFIYINEKFALSLLLKAVDFPIDEHGSSVQDTEILTQKVSSFFYHLKYRNTNPQTLELMLIGIETGTIIHPN